MITAAFVTVCLGALAQIGLTIYVIANRKMNVKLAFALVTFVGLSAVELTAMAGFGKNVELVRFWDFEVQNFERQVGTIKDKAGQQIDGHARRQIEATEAAVKKVARAGADLEKQTERLKSAMREARDARAKLDNQLQAISRYSSSVSTDLAELEEVSKAVALDLEQNNSLVQSLGENVAAVRGMAESTLEELDALRAGDAGAAEQIAAFENRIDQSLEQNLAQMRSELAARVQSIDTEAAEQTRATADRELAALRAGDDRAAEQIADLARSLAQMRSDLEAGADQLQAAATSQTMPGVDSAALASEAYSAPGAEPIDALDPSARELVLQMTKLAILQVAAQTPNGADAREAAERELLRESVALLNWIYPEPGDRAAWIEDLNESLGMELVTIYQE